MAKGKDLIGLRFGKLVVQWPSGRQSTSTGKQTCLWIWLCLCDCGNFKNISSSSLSSGNTKSCGCLAKEKLAIVNARPRIKSGLCSKCKKLLTPENSIPPVFKQGSGYCNTCRRDSGVRDEEHRKAKVSRDALRDQVFDALSHKCTRCGFEDKRALQIDHVNGGGEHDRQRFSQTTFLKYVLENLSLFQVLCANCNWIKRSENGEVFTKKNSFRCYPVSEETHE